MLCFKHPLGLCVETISYLIYSYSGKHLNLKDAASTFDVNISKENVILCMI